MLQLLEARRRGWKSKGPRRWQAGLESEVAVDQATREFGRVRGSSRFVGTSIMDRNIDNKLSQITRGREQVGGASRFGHSSARVRPECKTNAGAVTGKLKRTSLWLRVVLLSVRMQRVHSLSQPTTSWQQGGQKERSR